MKAYFEHIFRLFLIKKPE